MSAIAFFAHPGHELRVLGWCMRHRPTVCFLTNGQGSKDKGRLERSVDLLSAIGCRVSTRSGSISDREVYGAMLEDRPEAVADFFTSALEEVGDRVDRLVFDRIEGFNPTHDLVGVLGRRMEQAISKGRRGAKPSAWAISLEALPGDDEHHPNSRELCRCTDEELELKLAFAQSYQELAPEVVEAIRRVGAETFRTEWGHPIDPGLSLEELIPSKPEFERFGEERVRDGIYSRVLRRDDHLLPFLRRLLKQLAFYR